MGNEEKAQSKRVITKKNGASGTRGSIMKNEHKQEKEYNEERNPKLAIPLKNHP